LRTHTESHNRVEMSTTTSLGETAQKQTPVRLLVTFASKHGSTQEMAERIASSLNRLGVRTDVRATNQVSAIDIYDGVVIGSSIYIGHWMKAANQFVERVRPALAARRLWLFSSGPLGNQPATDPPEIALLGASLKVVEHRVFSGALRKDRLSLVERALVMGVKAPYGDFRNWTEIEAWTASIAMELKHGVAPQARPARTE
jgi:menaquinone-dependent protoporphyrinogen oxidase